MASTHNNGPPLINYATHLRRQRLPSREATFVSPVSTPPASPTKLKSPQPVPALPTSTYEEPHPQPPPRSSHWFIYDEPHPQPPPRSSHLFIYEELPALPHHTLIGAQSEQVVHLDGKVDVTEAPLDGLAEALEGLSIGATHTAPFAAPMAPARGSALATAPPPPVTHPLPVPFAHVTPGRKMRFYSVTVGKCCGVFSNWNFVTALVSGVSGSSFKGFKSYQDAIENYYEAKSRGCVRVERVPGDDARFGPLSQAIM